MAYNNPTPDQSTTLSADERAAEALRLVRLLRAEDDTDLARRLTSRAYEFVREQISALELLEELHGRAGVVGLPVTIGQLHWLRDSWEKFA